MQSLRRKFLSIALFSFASVLMAESTIHTKVDENPQPLRTPPPAYPAQLKQDNVSGMVLLDVVINDEGAVTEVAVVKSTLADFEAPSLQAVKAWRFRPGMISGKPVAVRLRLPVKFTPAS